MRCQIRRRDTCIMRGIRLLGPGAVVAEKIEPVSGRLPRSLLATLAMSCGQQLSMVSIVEADAAFLSPATEADVSRPFVGRDCELQALRLHWERARASSAQVVLVSGEAGIGKTSLLSRFLAGLKGRGILLYEQAIEDSPSPLRAMIEAFSDYLMATLLAESGNSSLSRLLAGKALHLVVAPGLGRLAHRSADLLGGV